MVVQHHPPARGRDRRDVAETATAYANRDAGFAININGIAEDPANREQIVAWTRSTFDAMAPFSTGGVYVNFMGDEGDARVRAAYGPAYERLAALKARYDPTNVFRTNHPAGRLTVHGLVGRRRAGRPILRERQSPPARSHGTGE